MRLLKISFLPACCDWVVNDLFAGFLLDGRVGCVWRLRYKGIRLRGKGRAEGGVRAAWEGIGVGRRQVLAPAQRDLIVLYCLFIGGWGGRRRRRWEMLLGLVAVEAVLQRRRVARPWRRHAARRLRRRGLHCTGRGNIMEAGQGVAKATQPRRRRVEEAEGRGVGGALK